MRFPVDVKRKPRCQQSRVGHEEPKLPVFSRISGKCEAETRSPRTASTATRFAGFPLFSGTHQATGKKRCLFALTLCEACRHSRHPRRICRRGQIEEIVVGAVVGSEAGLEAALGHARSLPKVDIGPSPRHAQAAVVVLTQPPTRPLTLASSEKLTLLPTKLKPLISAQVTSIVAIVSKKVPPLNEPKR